jgi:hypothetical protein
MSRSVDIIEHNEILKGFRHLKKAREVFEKFEKHKPKLFSGNDNHIGDIGEYWALRYYNLSGIKATLAPKKNSS